MTKVGKDNFLEVLRLVTALGGIRPRRALSEPGSRSWSSASCPSMSWPSVGRELWGVSLPSQGSRFQIRKSPPRSPPDCLLDPAPPPSPGGYSEPASRRRLVSDGMTTRRLSIAPSVGRPGPAPVTTVPAPAAIVGARDAPSDLLPVRWHQCRDRWPPHRQWFRLMGIRCVVVGFRARLGVLSGAEISIHPNNAETREKRH